MTGVAAPEMTLPKAALRPARLRPVELLRLGLVGVRGRPLRVFLSALGIAIGIAAMVAVVGISASSRAELDATLARLGTNLLTVAPGVTVAGDETTLPDSASAMVGRIGPVHDAAAIGKVAASVYRNDHIAVGRTGGIAVFAAELDLPRTVGATVGVGAWLDPATATYPGVVLGSAAAERLDIRAVGGRVWLGGQWFGVVGILDPVPLAKELDSAVLVGWGAAGQYLGFDGHPAKVYARAAESQVEAVRSVLGASANPSAPHEVTVSRPSDALAAKRAANAALDRLLLGLGAVALLVGGVGVANTMVISVLERRAEIGLRRSLGATRGHIRAQFLAESAVLSALGGISGVLLGVVTTAGYAVVQGWPTLVPAWATLGGFLVTLCVGALAGLYPAIRAARLTPTEALATP
ncbi:ABC transporter permease [Actinopolymorpha alba]|uniref:ABC transporter permease n=1 Tax=Actinopolymorpha alba TaxID=533267 RepID=UPI0003786DE7|nr:ABC transporter permease [Actinopolymorpha alba]